MVANEKTIKVVRLDVTVKIPKPMADFIHKHKRFVYYRDLEDFCTDAIRRLLESWKEIDAEVSEDDRELVRSDLADLARHLKEKYSLSVEEIRRFLREMLTVSV